MVSGQFFGEVALLTGEPRSATIVAATEVELYEVTRDHLMELLHNRPEIAEQMTETISAHRLRDLENIDKLTPEEQEAETKNLVQQMLGKVKKLFGLG
jgi:branched-chain amino acid transport system substrate-binding protein